MLYKIVTRALYVAFIVLLGYYIYASAVISRVNAYYDNHVLKSLEGKEYDSFIEQTMISLANEKYLEKPIYSFTEKDSEFKVEFYSFYAREKQGFLIFYRGIEEFIEGKDKIVGVNIRINTKSANSYLDRSVIFDYNGKNIIDNVSESMYITNTESLQYFSLLELNNDVKRLSEISSIKFSLIEEINEKETKVLDEFLVIENNEEFKEYFVEEELNKKENVLYTNSFNGTISYFNNYEEIYNSDNYLVKNVDLAPLKEYNYIIVRAMIIYSLIAVAATFLIFFLNPILSKIKAKKALEKK